MTSDRNESLVLVGWVDSRGLTSAWEFREELEPMDPVLCKSAGFLTDNAKGHKRLVMTTSARHLLGRLTIPSGAIRSVKKLKAKYPLLFPALLPIGPLR